MAEPTLCIIFFFLCITFYAKTYTFCFFCQGGEGEGKGDGKAMVRVGRAGRRHSKLGFALPAY